MGGKMARDIETHADTRLIRYVGYTDPAYFILGY